MNKLIITLSFCLLGHICSSQDAQYFYTEAKQALDNKDYHRFYSSIQKAHELSPYNQNILWYCGMAAALTNKPDESIEFLTRAININAAYDLDNANLSSVKNHPGFQKLLKTQETLTTPVIQSDTAFVLQDRQLHLESVAFDPVGKVLYGGSIHKRKIIKIDSKGSVSDFTMGEQYKMGSVFGLKVDTKKNVLWACSSAIPEMQHYDSTLASSLFRFDIKTGRLLDSYQPADTLSDHVFGDLALDSKGIPFVSDSRNNIIYQYNTQTNGLVPYFTSTEFWNIQGLAFSDGDKYLYIADYVKGIFLLDTQTMQLTKVKVNYDLSLKGTDGITFFNNSLITIQNGVHPYRVVRHYMEAGGMEFIRYEYIDNAHPSFGEPTVGSLSGNNFYYVANSQWGGYEKGAIKNPENLQPIVVLKYTFKDVK